MSVSSPQMPSLDTSKEEIRILVVEDEETTRELVQVCLERDGYKVVVAPNGEVALKAFAEAPCDLVILDLNMPVVDGWTVCEELRRRSDVPIMMLTANARPDDIVLGIQLGADNYITKPFTLNELRARVHAVLRRARQKQPSATNNWLRCGDISINQDSGEVRINGKEVVLAAIEYRLLKHLMQNPDIPVHNEELLSAVWGYEHQAHDDFNFIRVTMRRLRSKVEENGSSPKYLKTVHGRGYQFSTAGHGVEQLNE